MPGASTDDNVQATLDRLRDDGRVWRFEHRGNVYIVYPAPDSSHSAFIILKDGVVNLVILRISFDYPVEQMIKQFGEPEAIYKREFGDSDLAVFVPGATPRTPIPRPTSREVRRSCEEQEVQEQLSETSDLIGVLYPQLGIYFEVFVPGQFKGYVCPKMIAGAAFFFKALTLAEALRDDYLALLLGREYLQEVSEEDLIKWHGFGSGY